MTDYTKCQYCCELEHRDYLYTISYEDYTMKICTNCYQTFTQNQYLDQDNEIISQKLIDKLISDIENQINKAKVILATLEQFGK